MRVRLFATALTISFGLTACATNTELQPTEQEAALTEELLNASLVPATAEERAIIQNMDPLSRAAFWAEAYELNPGDREAAIELSKVLRQLGNADRAVEVSRQSLALYPTDPDLLRINGLALTMTGRGEQAVESLNRAIRAYPQDWQLRNALGIALEQSGNSAAARESFTQALLLAPTEPSVLSNLGLSFALSGNPGEAEEYLRRAVRLQGVSAQVRQNLALVVALQGRFDEAEEIARQDVSPAMAEANMAYVRAMISSPRSWDRLMADEPLNLNN